MDAEELESKAAAHQHDDERVEAGAFSAHHDAA
jgi:hypothetical protein